MNTSLLSLGFLWLAVAAIVVLSILRGTSRQLAFLTLNLIFVIGMVLGPAGAPRPPEEPLNQSHLSEPQYVDTAFRYGEHYRYMVRVVAVPGHPPQESADGEAREVLPLDIFPPAAPTGLVGRQDR